MWTRPVVPRGSFALAVLNKYNDAYPVITKLTLKYIGLTHPTGYNVTEVFDGKPLGVFKPKDILESTTNPTGIQLYRFTAISQIDRPNKVRSFKRKNLGKKLRKYENLKFQSAENVKEKEKQKFFSYLKL